MGCLSSCTKLIKYCCCRPIVGKHAQEKLQLRSNFVDPFLWSMGELIMLVMWLLVCVRYLCVPVPSCVTDVLDRLLAINMYRLVAAWVRVLASIYSAGFVHCGIDISFSCLIQSKETLYCSILTLCGSPRVRG